MNIPTKDGTYAGSITNSCACQVYDGNLGDFVPADDCHGDCWELQLEDFSNITKHLFTDNKQAFRITGLPLWNGPVNGYFSARNAEELLRAITVNRAEWLLELTVYPDHLTGVLSHHDASGTITVTPIES